MQNTLSQFLRQFIVLSAALGAALLFVVVAQAWTGPLSSPPTCVSGNPGCDAPLNVSGTAQTKVGGLQLNTNLNTNGLIVYGNVGVGVASPNAKLSIGNNVAPAGALNAYSKYQLMLYDSGTPSSSYGLGIRSSTMVFNSGGAYNFDTGGVTEVIFDASGNITATGYFHSSDARLKQNIQTIPGLNIIEQLRGVSFNWKASGLPSAGVIAQEVEQVLPSAVHTDASGMKSVDYDQIIGPLIEAVKTQQAEIDDLKAQVSKLEAVHQ